MNNRRTFIQLTGAALAGSIVLPQLACKSPKNFLDAEGKKGLDSFGIQLYTLRDEMPLDPKGVIQQLAYFGYNQLEGYEGPQGLFWGMGHQDFKLFLDDTGIKMPAAHCNIYDDFEQKVIQAAAIDMEYLICPWVGPQKSMDGWKQVCDLFNDCGALCKKHGIRFAYHNHAYTFKAFTGMIPIDYLMENTDPALVHHEMDIYWVVTGGADPIEYITKYSNRFRLCHIKDRMLDAGEEQHASCNLGTGMIDFPKILNVARQHGMKYFLVEQERYDDSTPLESARVGAEYLSGLSFG